MTEKDLASLHIGQEVAVLLDPPIHEPVRLGHVTSMTRTLVRVVIAGSYNSLREFNRVGRHAGRERKRGAYSRLSIDMMDLADARRWRRREDNKAWLRRAAARADECPAHALQAARDAFELAIKEATDAANR